MNRQSVKKRETRETAIELTLNLDGAGRASIRTGLGFFDHMLEAFARHGLFDLDVEARGDLHVDTHHLVEDTGIVLGSAFAEALGDRAGIRRFGEATIPMDDALVLVAVDLSGRPYTHWGLSVGAETLGQFETETAREFFIGFANASGTNLHVHQIAGLNSHHILEAAFKALGRALDAATLPDARVQGVPSTKGAL